MLRRLLVVLVQLYLTADYCDPSVPGVFFFETDSYYVDSVEARTAMPDLAAPMRCCLVPARTELEPSTPRAVAIAAPRVRLARYSPRSYIVAASTAPESSEEH